MLSLLLPGTVLALTGAAWAAQSKRKRPKPDSLKLKHRVIYEEAINGSYSADVYRQMAVLYKSQGYDAEAAMLEKRAALKETPKEITDERRKVFAAAMESFKPDYMRGLAAKYDEIGATGAAAKLRKRADEIEQLSEPGDSKPTTTQEAES